VRAGAVDRVAFAAANLKAANAFYGRLYGTRTHLDYALDGKGLVRQIAPAVRCSAPIKRMVGWRAPSLHCDAEAVAQGGLCDPMQRDDE